MYTVVSSGVYSCRRDEPVPRLPYQVSIHLCGRHRPVGGHHRAATQRPVAAVWQLVAMDADEGNGYCAA